MELMAKRPSRSVKSPKQITFDGYKRSFENQKRNFIVARKRSTSRILMRGKTILMAKGKSTNLEKKQRSKIIALFGQVSRAITAFIIKNGLYVEVIKQRHGSTFTNRKMYRQMKDNSKFYYVDISHCFWRISFLKNYVGEKLYTSVLEKPELKLYRNMALACIIAPEIREYYRNGVLLNTISEDRTIYSTIYNNIRYTAYNLMGDIKDTLPDEVIAYRTDGVMVKKSALSKVKNIFKDAGFSFSVVECYKQDELFYMYDDKQKKM